MKHVKFDTLKNALVAVMVAVATSASAANVWFDLGPGAMNANPASNRWVTLQALSPYPGNLVNYTSTIAGGFWASNLTVGDWAGEVKQKGSANAIKFQISLTESDTGVRYATNLWSVPGVQSYPQSGRAAWSIHSADLRYARYGEASATNVYSGVSNQWKLDITNAIDALAVKNNNGFSTNQTLRGDVVIESAAWRIAGDGQADFDAPLSALTFEGNGVNISNLQGTAIAPGTIGTNAMSAEAYAAFIGGGGSATNDPAFVAAVMATNKAGFVNGSITNDTTGNAASADYATQAGEAVSVAIGVTNQWRADAERIIVTNRSAPMVIADYRLTLTNLSERARNGERLNILWVGDSIADGTYYDTVSYMQHFHSAGVSLMAFHTVNRDNYVLNTVNDGYATEADVYWAAGQFYVLNSGNSTVWAGPGRGGYVPGDTFKMWYLQAPTNTAFVTVEVSTDNSTWTPIMTINTSGTRQLAVTNVTMALADYEVRLTVSGGGTFKYLWPEWFDSTAKRPRLYLANAPGKTQNDFLAMGTNNWRTILTNLAPDAIVYTQTKEIQWRTNWPAMKYIFQTYAPRADMIFCSTHHVDPTNLVVGSNDTYEQAALDRYIAATNGWAFLDLLHGQTWASVVTNGWSLDGVHYNDAGKRWEADRFINTFNIPSIIAVNNFATLPIPADILSATNLTAWNYLRLKSTGNASTVLNADTNKLEWHGVGSSSQANLLVTNVLSAGKSGLHLGQYAYRWNLAGDDEVTYLQGGTNGILFQTTNRQDGFFGVNAQQFHSGGQAWWERSAPAYGYSDPGGGNIKAQNVIARDTLYANSVSATGAVAATTFSGSGAGLSAIPRSGVTGLETALDYLTNNSGGTQFWWSNSAAANSISNNLNTKIAANLEVTGTNTTAWLVSDDLTITGDWFTSISNATVLATDGDGRLIAGTPGGGSGILTLDGYGTNTTLRGDVNIEGSAWSIAADGGANLGVVTALSYTGDGAPLTNLSGNVVIAGSGVTVTTNTIAGTGQKTFTVASTGGGTTYTNLSESAYNVFVRSNLTVYGTQTNKGPLYVEQTGNYALIVSGRVGASVVDASAYLSTYPKATLHSSSLSLGVTGLGLSSDSYVAWTPSDILGVGDTFLNRISAGTIRVGTNLVARGNIAATNGFTAYGGTFTGNGYALTNIQSTNIVTNVRDMGSTNYTITPIASFFYGQGTNQLVVLPNCTNTPAGTTLTIALTGTAYASAIVTNANGVQTILTAAGLSQTITNGQSITLVNTGSVWR